MPTKACIKKKNKHGNWENNGYWLNNTQKNYLYIY